MDLAAHKCSRKNRSKLVLLLLAFNGISHRPEVHWKRSIASCPMRLRAERPRCRAQIPALSVGNVGRVAVAVVRLQIAFTSEPLRPRIKSNLSEASGIVYSHHQAGGIPKRIGPARPRRNCGPGARSRDDSGLILGKEDRGSTARANFCHNH